MIQTTPFVIVDLETTGLEPKLDHIIEIGAVKLLNGEVIDEYSTLVNPGIFLPQETTHITGITTEMVADAPAFIDVTEAFTKFLGEDAVFVAHNVEFDWPFVNEYLKRHDLAELQNPYLCTFKLAKQVHPNLNAYSLGALSQTFQIDLPTAHRALHDARATAELFNKFLKMLQNGGLKHVDELPHIKNLPEAEPNMVEGQTTLF